MSKRVSLSKVLRRELGTTLASQGFVEVPQDKSGQTNYLVFFRKTPKNKSVGFWFQRDVKASNVEVLGSCFTLEFFPTLKNRHSPDQRERYAYLLNADELEEVRQLQNKMIKRMPKEKLSPEELEDLKEWFPRMIYPIKKPLEPSDVWMRYRDEEDLLGWTKFIERHFPSLVERFLSAKSK